MPTSAVWAHHHESGTSDRGLEPAERHLLELARLLTLPRTQAWKVLPINRARLDTYADRIGAGDAPTLGQLMAVDLLSADNVRDCPRFG